MLRTHDAARTGVFTAAIWLIGIGVVFLVQQQMDWSWGQAWPMFVILLGVGSLASLAVGPPRSAVGIFVALGWPLVVTAAGILLLLSTTGNLGIEPGELIGYWPLAAILGGLWLLIAAALPGRAGSDERLSLPLDGAPSATVRLRFGGGELSVGRAAAGALVDGEFRGGVRSRSRGSGSVVLEPRRGTVFGWWDEWPRWTMGVTGEVPLDLELEGGASKTVLDLSETRLRTLQLKTGASETRVQAAARRGHDNRPRRGGGGIGHASRCRPTWRCGCGAGCRWAARPSIQRIMRSGDGWESSGLRDRGEPPRARRARRGRLGEGGERRLSRVRSGVRAPCPGDARARETPNRSVRADRGRGVRDPGRRAHPPGGDRSRPPDRASGRSAPSRRRERSFCGTVKETISSSPTSTNPKRSAARAASVA